MEIFNLRVRKVLRDTWDYKARTGLVILTIAIGVFAVGSLARVWYILSENLTRNYLNASPAAATITTVRRFDEDLVTQVRRMSGVAEAEGVNEAWGRIQIGPNEWRPLLLSTRTDYVNSRVNIVLPQAGAWPPADDVLLLERSSLEALPYQIGDIATIEMRGGERVEIEIAGSVYDVTQISTDFSLVNYGYITPDTFFELTGRQDFTILNFTVAENPFDEDHIEVVLDDVVKVAESNGSLVLQKEIPEPGRHELDNIVQSVLLLLSALSGLGMLLSIFLVVNIVSALLTQQTEQIGTIKAVGGVSGQILAMYLGSVFLYGALALFASVPVGVFFARASSVFFADLINFDINSFYVPPRNWLLEFVVGGMLPTLAALYPVIKASRLTVRESIGFAAANQNQAFGSGGFEQLLNRLPELPVTLLYPFRNVFRRKVRLALATLTLRVAGAILIAVVSVRASFDRTVDDISGYWQEDINIALRGTSRYQRLERLLLDMEGIERVEPRLIYSGFRVRPDGRESTQIIEVFGLQPTSAFIQPQLIEGRWLTPEDSNAAVINLDLLNIEPDLGVGDILTIKIQGQESQWEVVGIVSSQVVGGTDPLMSAIAYVNYETFAREVGQPGQANRLLVGTTQHSPGYRRDVLRNLEVTLSERGIFTVSALQEEDLRAALGDAFAILVNLLQLSSSVFGIVGGLGLMSMMTLNVLERTREIGIIRSVGGVRNQLGQIIVIEGVFVGLLSWFLAVILAYPMSIVLGRVLGETLLRTPLRQVFPITGPLLWLLLVIVIAVLSSLIPGNNAARLSIREAISFE